MPAFSAAKRTALTLVGLVFLLSAPLALADNHSSGYLGVMLQEISPSMAKALQLDGKSGIMINNVIKDSPAAKAGLEDGDIILMFKGDAVESTGAFTKAVRAAKPGEDVEMIIIRNGKKQTVKVELAEHDQDEVSWFSQGDDNEHEVIIKKLKEGPRGNIAFFSQNDRGFLGVHLDGIEGQMADYFEVDGGALITEVNEDSPAAKAGLKAGDVIVKVDDMEIGDESDLHKAMQDTKPEQEVKVQVIRKGDKKTMKVTLGEMPDNMGFENIEIFTDGIHKSLRAPKMLYHGKGQGNTWTIHGDEMESMKKELQEMKKELQEMKKELKK
jgi:C-terminal processing protease CtpA/Prc